MLSEELRKFLSEKTCRDVVKIIEEYVLRQSRRVSRAFKAIVRNIEWEIRGLVYTQNVRLIHFGEVLKEIISCKECSTVSYIFIVKKNKFSSVSYWDCKSKGKCGDGKLYPNDKGHIKMIGNSFEVGYIDYNWQPKTRIYEF